MSKSPPWTDAQWAWAAELYSSSDPVFAQAGEEEYRWPGLLATPPSQTPPRTSPRVQTLPPSDAWAEWESTGFDTKKELEDTIERAPITFSAPPASAQPPAVASSSQAPRAPVLIAPAGAGRKRPAELSDPAALAKQQKQLSNEQLEQAGIEYRRAHRGVLTPEFTLTTIANLISTIDNQVMNDLLNAASIQKSEATYAKKVAKAQTAGKRKPPETDVVIKTRKIREQAKLKFHESMKKLVRHIDELEPQPDKDVGQKWTQITNMTRNMFRKHVAEPNSLFTRINWSDPMYVRLLTYLTHDDPLFGVIVGANVYPALGLSGEGAGLNGGYSACIYGGYYGVVATTRKSHP